MTEAAVGLETGTLNYMVLGAGVNLVPTRRGVPGGDSVHCRVGSGAQLPGSKNRLVGEFLNRFWDFYAHPECRAYLEDYRARSLAIGRNVTVLSAGRAVSAYAYGIDDDFRLLVRYDSGKTEALPTEKSAFSWMKAPLNAHTKGTHCTFSYRVLVSSIQKRQQRLVVML